MKSGVAVLLRLAEDIAADSRFDCTFVFYEAEEIADEHNGLRKLFAERPDLVAGDFAVLLEPTDLWLEAGCQGSIRLEATFHGRRAHTARPWQGVNAVYRAAPVLARLAEYQPEAMEVDGLRFRQALSVVDVRGGVAGNVVPDRCTVVVNRRYAPALTLEEAEAEVRALLDGADEVVLTSVSPAAPPESGPPAGGGVRRSARPPCPLQARLDRRGPLLGPRRSSRELRPRRPRGIPHRARARHPGLGRGLLRGAGRLPERSAEGWVAPSAAGPLSRRSCSSLRSASSASTGG